MGNIMGGRNKISDIKSIEDFASSGLQVDDETIGLTFNGRYLPEEIVINILSFVPPKQILHLSLVCKKWCQLVRSNSVWKTLYLRQYKKKPKQLPWFVYYCLFATNFFDTNLLKNNCGQCEFNHWIIMENGGDQFKIEVPPSGCQPLPAEEKDLNGFNSCFATSFHTCTKLQIISLDNCNLFSVILNYYMPTLYASEWYTGRFDCSSKYKLEVQLLNKEIKKVPYGDSSQYVARAQVKKVINQWSNPPWSKAEIIIKEYPPGARELIFLHSGCDKQFWKGHYGSKFTGGVVKFLFDSIEPKANDVFLNN